MFQAQPPKHSDEIEISFPGEHILLITFNRPKQLNAVGVQMTQDLNSVLNWFDNEPDLWCVVVTGKGRAFCAGQDLIALQNHNKSHNSDQRERIAASPHGFGSISRRTISSKPMIAAVNGFAFGGGLEIVLNCDIVIASEDAKFALPEVKRGVVAAQGGIPRIAAIAGRQLASELLLTGRAISPQEARDRFKFVNQVVPAKNLMPTALQWANDIIANSPDAVACTKRGILLGQQFAGIEPSTVAHAWGVESRQVYTGENLKEGLIAFAEKRKPVWRNPAKL